MANIFDDLAAGLGNQAPQAPTGQLNLFDELAAMQQRVERSRALRAPAAPPQPNIGPRLPAPGISREVAGIAGENVPRIPSDAVAQAGKNIFDDLAMAGVGLQQGFHALGEQGLTALQAGSEPLLEVGPFAVTAAGLQGKRNAKEAAGFFREAALEARKRAQDLEPLAAEIGGSRTMQAVGQGIPSIAPAIATGPLGAVAPIVASGIQQGLSTLSEAQSVYEAKPQLTREGQVIPNAAFRAALGPALADTVTTAAITAVSGKLFGKGVEGFSIPMRRQAIGTKVGEVVKDIVGESLEEGAQQFVSDYVIGKLSYKPEVTFEDAVKDALQAGIAGGVIGGAMGTLKFVPPQQPERRALRVQPGIEMIQTGVDDLGRPVYAERERPNAKQNQITGPVEEAGGDQAGRVPRIGPGTAGPIQPVTQAGQAQAVVTPPAPVVPEPVLGWVASPVVQYGGLREDQLAQLTPEQQAEMKAKLPAQVEWTDRRAGSPTEGFTVYVPVGATPQQIESAIQAKTESVLAAKRAPEPTEAQKKAGNYPKENVKVQGLDISIENKAGSTRSGVDKSGKAWSVEMKNDYGYIKRTEGKDGDQVDVYVGPNPESPQVFVIDQIDPESGKFDEHKTMVGFNNQDEALQAYQSAFSDDINRMGAITPMSMDQFKGWLKTGDTTKAIAYKKGGETRAQEKEKEGGPVRKPVLTEPIQPPAPAPASTRPGDVKAPGASLGTGQGVTSEAWKNAVVPVNPPFNIEDNQAYQKLWGKAVASLGLKPKARWTMFSHEDQLAIDRKIEEMAKADPELASRLSEKDGVTYLDDIPLIGWFRRVQRENEIAASKKEPWQQTLEEYGRDYEQDHRYRVELALGQGKPVPAEVLKDYPDLVKRRASGTKPSLPETKPVTAETVIPKVGDKDPFGRKYTKGDVDTIRAQVEAARRAAAKEPNPDGSLTIESGEPLPHEHGDENAKGKNYSSDPAKEKAVDFIRSDLSSKTPKGIVSAWENYPNKSEDKSEREKEETWFKFAYRWWKENWKPETDGQSIEQPDLAQADQPGPQAKVDKLIAEHPDGDDALQEYYGDQEGMHLGHKTVSAETLAKDKGRVLTQQEADKVKAQWAKQLLTLDQKRKENGQKIILSLFDRTGAWAEPFVLAGFDVRTIDLVIDNVDVMDINQEWLADYDMTDIWGILSANPCDDFAGSGARWWAGKDESGKTDVSVKLAEHTLAIIEYLHPVFWALENPVGRLSRLVPGVGEPRLQFHPNQYGDPYTKRTQIFGNFNPNLPQANVFPDEASKMHNLRGDDPEQKLERSETPEGFALAFALAQMNVGPAEEMEKILGKKTPPKAPEPTKPEAKKPQPRPEGGSLRGKKKKTPVKPAPAPAEVVETSETTPSPPKEKTIGDYSQDEWDALIEGLEDALDAFAPARESLQGRTYGLGITDLFQFSDHARKNPEQTIAEAWADFKGDIEPANAKKIETVLREAKLLPAAGTIVQESVGSEAKVNISNKRYEIVALGDGAAQVVDRQFEGGPVVVQNFYGKDGMEQAKQWVESQKPAAKSPAKVQPRPQASSLRSKKAKAAKPATPKPGEGPEATRVFNPETQRWVVSDDWRKSFRESTDIETKIDWLRAVANNRGHKASAEELKDVLAYTEDLMRQQKHSRLENTLWDISKNPAASPETASRAQQLLKEAQALDIGTMTPDEAVRAGEDRGDYYRAVERLFREGGLTEEEYRERSENDPSKWPKFKVGQEVFVRGQKNFPGKVTDVGYGWIEVTSENGEKSRQTNLSLTDLKEFQAKHPQTAVPAAVKPEAKLAETPVKQQKAGFDSAAAKAQKKFLLEQVDEAIKEAPDEQPTVPADSDRDAYTEAHVPYVTNEAGERVTIQERNERAAQILAPLMEKYQIPTEHEVVKDTKVEKGEGDNADKIVSVAPYRVTEQYTDENRQHLLDAAISKARYEQLPKVTIEIPGDGTFDILNNKESLKAFKEKAAKFPTTMPPPKQPGFARTTATKPAALGKLDTKGTLAALKGVVSTDMTRFVINFLWSDGNQTVATDGRRLTVIKHGIGGTEKQPMVFDLTGKVRDDLLGIRPPETSSPKKKKGAKVITAESEQRQVYPTWQQIMPEDFKHEFKNLDTERLFTLLRQAQEATSEKFTAAVLWQNKDGSYGLSANSPDLYAYVHNVTPDAKPLFAFNPYYMADAVNSARAVGDKTVAIRWTDELSPFQVVGKSSHSVIMPMRLEGDFDKFAREKAGDMVKFTAPPSTEENLPSMSDEAYQRFRAAMDERNRRDNQLIQDNLEAAGDKGVVRLVRTNDEGFRTLIVAPSPDPKEAGQWRVTAFDEHGPWGHHLFKSRDAALRAASGESFTDVVNGPAYYSPGAFRVEKVAGNLASAGWTEMGPAEFQGDTQYHDLLSQWRTADEVIGRMLLDKKTTPFQRELLQRLRRIKLKTRVKLGTEADKERLGLPSGSGGVFNTSDVIYLFPSSVNNFRTLLHEFIHAATLNATRNDPAFAAELQEMLEQAKKSVPSGRYGLTNIDEFLAEAFSNPEFQEDLRKINVGGRNLWQQFVDWVRKVLGMQSNQRTLLQEVIELGSQKFAPIRATSLPLEGQPMESLPSQGELRDYDVYIRYEFPVPGQKDEPIRVTARSKSEAINRARPTADAAKDLGVGRMFLRAVEVEPPAPTARERRQAQVAPAVPRFIRSTGFRGEHLVTDETGQTKQFPTAEEADAWIKRQSEAAGENLPSLPDQPEPEPPPSEIGGPSLADVEASGEAEEAVAEGIKEGLVDKTQRMGVLDRIKGRQHLTPAVRDQGRAHAMSIFAQAGLQVQENEDGWLELVDPKTPQEAEGQRLLKLVKDEIGKYQDDQTGFLGNLINSVRNMTSEGVPAFSEALNLDLYAATQGEASHRGLMLAALAGLQKSIAYIGRRVKATLHKEYYDRFGGEAIAKVVEKIKEEVKKELPKDAEVDQIIKDNPKLQETFDKAVERMLPDAGGRLYRKVQSYFKPRKPSRKRMVDSALLEEAFNEIIEQAKKLGLTAPEQPKKKLTPREQLAIMAKPETVQQLNDAIEQAVMDAEFNAGRAVAMKNATSDEEKAAIQEDGWEPSEEEIEEGLEDPKFAHWKEIRDNLLQYSPTTVRLVEKLIQTEFKGTEYAKRPKVKEDLRIDFNKLATAPEAEVRRVLKAYYDGIESVVKAAKSTPAMQQRILDLVAKQVGEQLDKAKARAREPMFKEPVPTGQQLPGAREMDLFKLANAGLFLDPRLNSIDQVKKVAMKSPFTRFVPNLRDLITAALETPFYRQGDLGKAFADEMVKRLGLSPGDASGARSVFNEAFSAKFKKAREIALERVEKSLTPQERREMSAKKATWKKITEAVNAGAFDTSEILQKIAKVHGWNVPTDEDAKEIKDLVEKMERLRELTQAERDAVGDDPVELQRAAADKAAVTLEKRVAIKKKIEAKWARLTHPFSIKSKFGRQNIAAAINEMTSANLLLKVSFPFRQIIDVLTQGALHTPTRAIQAALERHALPGVVNAETGEIGNKQALWQEVSDALGDAYRTRAKAYKAALQAARDAFAGTGEARNVDRLMSRIGLFDRAADHADQLAAEGKTAQAAALRLFTFLRLGFRVAQGMDNIHGLPAEWQEMRQQVVTALRERGQSPAEAFKNADSIIGDMKAEHQLAVARAQQILESTGEPFTANDVKGAAWQLVKGRAYQRMREAGLPADAFEENNRLLRSTVGWNEREQGGIGGVVAGTMGAAKSALQRGGLPGPLLNFGNAIGTAINRSLSFTPLGFFPGLFEGSPWYKTEADKTQRKVEAAAGSSVGLSLMLLALSGALKVRNRWPRDKEERELWEREGHRPGTAEIDLGDGNFLPISLTTGPLTLVRPWLAAGGAMRDALDDKAKAQAKLNAEAEAKGLPPGEVEPLGMGDLAAIAGDTAWGSIVGGRTASGLVQSVTDYGTPNIRKTAAAFVSPMLPTLPAAQEFSRMAGVRVNPSLASFQDFLLPLPSSKAAQVNMLGDPVGNDDAVQRITQILTGGTGLPVDVSEKRNQDAYRALYVSEYRPPSINPGKGYAIDGEYRPMTDTELSNYTKLRGQYFKEELANLGEEPTKAQAKAAFQLANARALSEMGVAVPPTRATQPTTTVAATTVSPTGTRTSVVMRRPSGSSLRRGRRIPTRAGRRRSLRGSIPRRVGWRIRRGSRRRGSSLRRRPRTIYA